MRRVLLPVVLLTFAVANFVAGLSYGQHLERQRQALQRAVKDSPFEAWRKRTTELIDLERARQNWQQRAGLGIPDAIQLFDAAAVGWEEIALGSSGEAGQPRLDVLSVRGLAGTVEQLSRVDRRLGPRCRSYRRSPTRDARFLLSCQMKPKRR